MIILPRTYATVPLKHRFYIEAGKDKISKEQADAIGVDFSKSY